MVQQKTALVCLQLGGEQRDFDVIAARQLGPIAVVSSAKSLLGRHTKELQLRLYKTVGQSRYRGIGPGAQTWNNEDAYVGLRV